MLQVFTRDKQKDIIPFQFQYYSKSCCIKRLNFPYVRFQGIQHVSREENKTCTCCSNRGKENFKFMYKKDEKSERTNSCDSLFVLVSYPFELCNNLRCSKCM